MSIWTLTQIRQVEGLRASAVLDVEVEDRSNGAASVTTKQMMAQRLIDMAHPFAVEVAPDDIQFVAKKRDDRPWQVTIRGRWAPTTNAALLIGGPRDGERWAMQRIGEPFRVEVLESTPWLGDETSAEMAVGMNAVTYVLTGWHETERCWVYTPSTSRA